MAQSILSTPDALSLERIRSTLIRLEDTIIFSLIERAQFAHNPRIYEPKAFPELTQLGFEGSWLDWFLTETEVFHAKARRYTSPDEYPFTAAGKSTQPLIPAQDFERLLHPDGELNVTSTIQQFYTGKIIPRIAAPGASDDGHYGSSATVDVQVLQAIAKRVHYGKFVSESKFRADPAPFVAAIRARDSAALDALITKPAVERAVIARLAKKARMYGRDLGPDGEPLGSGWKIDVQCVVDLYEQYMIPLTKDVEVEYLLRRLDGLSEEEVNALCKTKL